MRAAVSAALVVCLGAAPAAPGEGTLPNGMRYALAPDPAAPAAAVELWYRAPSGGFGSDEVAGFARLAATAVAGSTPITGTPLGRLVTETGGRLSVSAFPDTLTISALVPPAQVAAVVRAMTADYFAPVLDEKGLGLAKAEVAEESLLASYDPHDALENALGAALFSAGPLHTGTLGTGAALRAVALPSVRTFAERAFRPGNAVLVISGAVDPSALDGVADREAAPGAPEPPSPETLRPSPGPVAVSGNTTGIGLAWPGPPISDETSATALDLLAYALFTPGTGTAQAAAASARATVTGTYVTYHDPGVFFVTIAGEGAAAARPAVERAIAAAAKPMDGARFEAVRKGFAYEVLSNAATPVDVADSLGWYTVEGAPAYAPTAAGGRGGYAARLAALTPRSVAAAAARWLGSRPAVVTLSKSARPPARGGTR